jgi:hypothetical protein
MKMGKLLIVGLRYAVSWGNVNPLAQAEIVGGLISTRSSKYSVAPARSGGRRRAAMPHPSPARSGIRNRGPST